MQILWVNLSRVKLSLFCVLETYRDELQGVEMASEKSVIRFLNQGILERIKARRGGEEEGEMDRIGWRIRIYGSDSQWQVRCRGRGKIEAYDYWVNGGDIYPFIHSDMWQIFIKCSYVTDPVQSVGVWHWTSQAESLSLEVHILEKGNSI